MNTRNLGCLVVTLFVIAGCIPSLNPIYRPENLVFDSAVIGEWHQPKSSEAWQFTKRNNKSYNLVYTDEQGRRGQFIAHIAEIHGQRFLDIFPDETKLEGSGFYKFHLVPIHTIYLIRRTQPGIELAAIDYPWLDNYLAEHPQAIEHTTFGGRKLITAATEDVQAFALEHFDAFTAPFELERATKSVK